MTPQDQLALAQSCLAYKLRPEHLEELYRLANPVYFQHGQELIRHNGTDADLYVILEGHVCILTDDGDKFFDATAGSVVGELAFLDALPRAANALAGGHVYALKFCAADLRKLMCSNKELGFFLLANLTRVVCARLRKADEDLDKLMDNAHDAWSIHDT
jgi:CRP/FNR family cyclic AMP-dependent transcriptional regulator